MRDSFLPAFFAYAAFALATIPLSVRKTGAAAFVMVATALAFGNIVGTRNVDLAFTAVWSTALSCAGIAAIGYRLPVSGVFGLAIGGGTAIGALAAATGREALALTASPALLILLFADLERLAVGRIARRISAGWIIAIALLSIAVPFVTTPGYQKDHIE